MANLLLATREWVTAQINAAIGNGGGGGQAPTYANAPAGAVFYLRKNSSGVWPARPSARTDIAFFWIGPDPDPVFGGVGMINGLDVRIVTPA